MYITNVTDDYDNITDFDNMTLSNCTNNGDNFDIILPALLYTIPCGPSILHLLSLMAYTLNKPLFNNIEMEKLLNPNHPVRCIICGPSNVGKSVFLTNINLNIINEHDKIYICSTSLHQDLYQKLIKCFSN